MHGPEPPAAIAVFDIDGVLADVRHRLHLLETRPKDWAGFFAAAPDDLPLAKGVALVRELETAYRIVYVTGRPERCRDDTLRWLRDHTLPSGKLIMRGDRDRRPASVVKAAIVDELARQASVAVVVDDDAAVCAALRSHGYPVLTADWLPSMPALTDGQERLGRT